MQIGLLGNVKHEATIAEIKLSCVFFNTTFGQIYSVGSSLLFHCQDDSSKLHSVFKMSLFGATTKASLSFIGEAFHSLTQPLRVL